MSTIDTTDTKTPPRDLAPVKLHNYSDHSAWLRLWSNGEETLIRNDEGHWVGNPKAVNANVYRTQRNSAESTWTVRIFVAGELSDGVAVEDVRTLRMVRQLLAYFAADWKPTTDNPWVLYMEASNQLQKSFLEAADAEVARV